MFVHKDFILSNNDCEAFLNQVFLAWFVAYGTSIFELEFLLL